MTSKDRAAKEQENAARRAGEEAAHAVNDETGIGDRPSSDAQQPREEIKETAEDMGQAAEAPAQKADVKGQVQQKVAERKDQLRGAQDRVKTKLGETAQQAKRRPAPIGAALGVVVAALVVLWLIRRR